MIRHTTCEIARVRKLRDAGWTLRQIAQLVEAEFGRPVHWQTVQVWCDPAQREAKRQRLAAARARRRAKGPGLPAWRNQLRDQPTALARARCLRQLGLGVRQTIAVVEHDVGVVLAWSVVNAIPREPGSWRPEKAAA